MRSAILSVLFALYLQFSKRAHVKCWMNELFLCLNLFSLPTLDTCLYLPLVRKCLRDSPNKKTRPKGSDGLFKVTYLISDQVKPKIYVLIPRYHYFTLTLILYSHDNIYTSI